MLQGRCLKVRACCEPWRDHSFSGQLRAMEVRQAWVDKPQLGELLSLQQLDSWHRCCKVFETEQMRSLLCEVFETELQLDHKVSQLRINVV